MKEAHDAVIKGFKVNFANIPASRLVAKLRDEKHNCWGDCDENGSEMQTAIEEWNNAIKDSGTSPQSPQTNPELKTGETLSLETEFNDPSKPKNSNTVKINIDSVMLGAPMVLARPLDQDPYIHVPNTNQAALAATATNAGIGYFSFTVPQNGQYQVWGNAVGENTNDNSFFISVYEGSRNLSGTRQFDTVTGSQSQWRRVNNINLTLEAGKIYTLEVRQREDGTRLSGLVVTADTSFDPLRLEDYFGVTLSFNLSSILKGNQAELLIDVIDYDPYSYKVFNPRIRTSASNIYVKGVKLLVNGIYSPQHSTYTIVDKIITPQDGLLSEYAMIVLKDQGPSGDRFRFSFDQISPTSQGSGGPTGTTGGASNQTSLMAFQETVYPVSRSSSYSCVGCHMSVSPRHASDNTLTAHDSALSVVDFTTPSNSRIVRKMRDQRHNCQTYCDSIANEYERAIMEWRTRRVP